MDMRTPLNRVRGLGSAKDGTDTFWRQRITAVALVPLFIFFIVFLIAHVGAPYEDVVGALSNPFIAVLLGIMVIAGLVHMRIGMQEIIDDYIHGEKTKLLAVIANTFFTIMIGALCLYAVLKLGFGG